MSNNVNEIIEVCLLAGKIMLSNGGETYRTEDTMSRIAKAYNIDEVHSYVTPTGIFLTVQAEIEDIGKTKFIRITERSIDLNKVSLVNDISRQICLSNISIEEAYKRLFEVEKLKTLYPLWVQIFAAAIASAFFALMFGGMWADFLPAFLAGGIGFLVFNIIHRFIKVKFFSEIIASFTIGILAVFFVKYGIGLNQEKIIIGSIMPLVPGLIITNAVRDLMAGDLVSGLARGSEALITALAIGVGIASVIAIF